jgi:hypothetical protein
MNSAKVTLITHRNCVLKGELMISFELLNFGGNL